MSDLCGKLHHLFNNLKRYSFPYYANKIPLNGLYILFERGEKGHGVDRIVRIGTHTGENQLPARLKQHFLNENKDRSIFRKNIGRAILNKTQDKYIKIWNLDLTTRKAKAKYSNLVDFDRQSQIEQEVSKYIREYFTFTVIEVNSKIKRLEIESKLISTVSLCVECRPTQAWLGNYSPKKKIRESGLWQVNELYKTSIAQVEFDEIKALAGKY